MIKMKNLIDRISGQVWFVLLLVSVFNFNACIHGLNKMTVKTAVPVFLIWIITLIYGVVLLKKCRLKYFCVEFKDFVVARKSLWIILLIAVSLRIPMFDTMPKWDAGEYYYRLMDACKNYDFTCLSIWENFRLCAHSNIGFSITMALAEFLTPGNPMGVYLWNLILTLVALVFLYDMLLYKWNINTGKMAELITLAVSCTPIFLGTFTYFNVDYFLALVFIYVLYFDYKRAHILAVLSLILLSQTKETGVVLVAGYLIFMMVEVFVSTKAIMKTRILKVVKSSYFTYAVIAAIVYLLQMIKMGGMTDWKHGADTDSAIFWSNTGLNCFGYQPGYILYKTKQMFLMNFSWIFTLILIVTMGIIVYRHLLARKTYKKMNLMGTVGAMLFFYIFNILYVTYTLPRYLIFFETFLALVALIVGYYIIGLKKDKNIIYSIFIFCVSGLLMVQSYWNVDIISSNSFNKIPISDKNSMLFSSYNYYYFGDGLVTNYQYSWIDKAFNEYLDNTQYTVGDIVIVPDNQYLASHVSGNENVYKIMWDSNKKKRVTNYEEADGIIPIEAKVENSIFTQLPKKNYQYMEANNINKRSSIFFLPYYKTNENNTLEKYVELYYISPRRTVKQYGGELAYYQMITKDAYNGIKLSEVEEIMECSEASKISWNESELKNAVEKQMQVCGWSSKKVEEYFTNLLWEEYNVCENDNGRKIVELGDVIDCIIVVKDESGQTLSNEYVGSYFGNCFQDLIVEKTVLMDGIVEMLVGIEVGETVEAWIEIPKDYYDLAPYNGNKLHFYLTPKEIKGKAEFSCAEKDMEEIYEEAYDTSYNYYLNLAVKEVLAKINGEKVNWEPERVKKVRNEIKRYYESYYAYYDISEEQFLSEYAELGMAEFQTHKENLIEISLKKDYIMTLMQSETDKKDVWFHEAMDSIRQNN